jgi:AbiJ N-terminal domain 3
MAHAHDDAVAEQTGQPRQITAVTRRDIFDYVRAECGEWWGRLDEIAFLDRLYDLDALPSTDSRYTTARGDIIQHRMNNDDWDDDWVFDDPRLALADGPDETLLAFLADLAHPVVQSDVKRAARLVADLNDFLAPDGWALQPREFISGRPVYAPARVPRHTEATISLPLEDDATDKLDLVLGQTHRLLGENGDALAQRLLLSAGLALRRDGGYFHPIPGDNWRSDTYEAVLTVPAQLVPEFTTEVIERIWQQLTMVLGKYDRHDVQAIVIEEAAPPLPYVQPDWRQLATAEIQDAPTNQARRERAGEGYPTQDGLTFTSRAEVVVYQLLVELQRERPIHNAIAVMPLPGAKLRDAGVRTPDFVVLGNGRAVVIEVDGPHHYGRTRKADDADRDRHWERCGIRAIRIGSHHTEDRESLKERLREDLTRTLIRPQ